ncbi:enoyl-CoA hydratase/isomerase family protein [Ignavigranum ruoffiae]|uniref:enoyl-CoA hydratase/isomerase family protein n=1 Tax=Ignavigranum ruoffiae TaxID=89093 RepID=UPI0024AC8D63|nr:enoyl-CoA hydratase/isomerase family protein [Ignavigranum ruoffiae]
MYQTLTYELKNRIAYVTLNRPQQGNAFAEESYAEIKQVFDQINQDDQVDVAILTGKGKHFSAGGDIQLFQQMLEQKRYLTETDILATGAMVNSIKQNKKVVIAAINGIAAGAGLGLALACDFILMEEQGKLLTAFIGLAFPGDTDLIYHLYQAMPTQQLNSHLMLNEPISAEQGRRYGLVNQVVPPGQVVSAAEELARKLQSGPLNTYAYQKELLASLNYPEIDQFNQQEAKFMSLASRQAAHAEAVTKFLQK